MLFTEHLLINKYSKAPFLMISREHCQKDKISALLVRWRMIVTKEVKPMFIPTTITMYIYLNSIAFETKLAEDAQNNIICICLLRILVTVFFFNMFPIIQHK